MNRSLSAVLVAVLVVTAGCSGLVPGGGDGSGSGTMSFYVSDQPGAIDEFESMNVTITKVGLHEADGNETEAGNESEWVTKDVNDTRVDLTELKGENATLLEELNVSAGTYDKVFIHVEDASGTLKSGEETNVKIPSSKLHVNKNVTVDDGEDVEFVYDVTVVKAGNSGKYIVKPVVSESGTDVEIEEVDDAEVDEDDDGDDGDAQQGRMAFYVSDERNAIDDFASLNVTITEVGFHEVDGNETEAGNESDDEGEDGEWVTRDVDDTTVDLTELKGDNATMLEQFNVSAGTYDKVFVHVGETNGTLQNGEQVNVKLPSQKLHINERFTVEDGEEVEFVYDITVFEAGNSGKYILKPVVSESGTDVPIDEVGEDDEEREDDERERDGDDAEAELDAAFDGDVTRGENATVTATYNGSAAADANVTVTVVRDTTNGTVTESLNLTTDANGTATFAVPENATELSVLVEYADDEEAELEREFEDDEERAADDNGQGNGQQSLAA